jgi:hypothetical protein
MLSSGMAPPPDTWGSFPSHCSASRNCINAGLPFSASASRRMASARASAKAKAPAAVLYPSVTLQQRVEQVGIIEVPTADKRGRLMSRLAHRAGAGDAHRPEQEALEPLTATDQAVLAI